MKFFRGNANFKIMKCEDLLYVVRFQYVWLIVVTLFSSSWLEAGSSIAMRDFQFEISIHDFIHSQVYWDMNKILSTNYSLHICKMNAERTALVKEITILYTKRLCRTPQKNFLKSCFDPWTSIENTNNALQSRQLKGDAITA